jgi:hypothetical protein
MYEKMYSRTWEAHSTPENRQGNDTLTRRGDPDTGLIEALSLSPKQEGEPKLTWRNPGWVGVVSSIVIGGGESPLHGEGLDGST